MSFNRRTVDVRKAVPANRDKVLADFQEGAISQIGKAPLPTKPLVFMYIGDGMPFFQSR
jgi:hypothetical protein